MTCPFCDSSDVERVGQWGGQIITSQWRCSSCNSYFEAVREDFDDAQLPRAIVMPTSTPTSTASPSAAAG